MVTCHTSIVSEPNPYRELPSVDELAGRGSSRLPRPLLVELARAVIQRARDLIGEGKEPDVTSDMSRLVESVERSSGIEIINATGTLLHTNLGRARWSDVAASRASRAATRYTNVELDLDSGDRSRRGLYVSTLLRALTGAEEALVVNNNASALLLALAATSAGLAVPVSRGELIEIGGSYRLPAVMGVSGARLVEVGTTNRTRIGDFETALQIHECGAVLKVHPSNYRVEGFTESPTLSEIAHLTTLNDLPFIFDIGSGLLDADTPWLPGPTPSWLRAEPAARQSLADGVDLVTFSGDKLVGGPQAGIVVGRADLIDRLARHPLTRALRVDGPTLAGLAATLEVYLEGNATSLPFWHQATLPNGAIERRALALADALDADVTPGESAVGAGSAPGMTIPTTLVTLRGEDHLFERLLRSEPPIICRRDAGSLLIDLRTVDPEHDELIREALSRCR